MTASKHAENGRAGRAIQVEDALPALVEKRGEKRKTRRSAGTSSLRSGRAAPLRRRALAALLALGLALGAFPASAKDVPYVPTPEDMVEEMLNLAAVTPDDVVYDLGCGDGRIVVAAAKRGARAVGVDIDPDRIRESMTNASKAGVNERTRFYRADLFQAEIKPATVVTLYLLTSVNLRLRPRLLSELKPGTRIVSQTFDMNEWKPDQVSRRFTNPIYLWIVPANAAGDWEWTLKRGSGATGVEERWTMRLAQSFQELQGQVGVGGSTLAPRGLKLVGDRMAFRTESAVGGRRAVTLFEGRVRGDEILGEARREGSPEVMAWRATRRARAAGSLDDPLLGLAAVKEAFRLTSGEE